MSKLDRGPALDVPSLSLSLCFFLFCSVKWPSVSALLFLSFTTSYSVLSPDPYHEPKISHDIYRPAERKTGSKEKADIFFTLRSLSRWLLRSVTERFWRNILWFVSEHMAARPFALADSCKLKVILCHKTTKTICIVLELSLYVAFTKVF